MRVIAAVAAAFLVAFASASADEGHRAADEAALTQIKTDAWPGFYRTQDAEGLAAFLDAAFVNIGPDGSMTPRAEELAAVRADPWMPANFRYEITKFVWLRDDLVIIVGRGSSDRTDDDGKPCRHVYASSNLLERAGDAPLGWRALSSHVSGVECKPA